ncbi:EAGR box-containing protein [[Mycoplasma] imitans]|uniref:EAGR box-containing protein n=1 Tax=[Mycoplasma] imitans TaxID=29560 RepID=UPI001FE0F7AD|nr:EAGR box-containing protein [[Mycoplasma] imitans]
MADNKKTEKKTIKNKSAHDNEPASISLDGNSKKKVSKKALESLNYSDYYKKYLESKKDDFELLAKKASIDTIKDKEAIKEEIKAEAFYAESALDYTKEMKDESYSDHFKEMKDIDKKNLVISNEMKHDNKKEDEGEFIVRNQYHPSFNDAVASNSFDDLPDFDGDSSPLNFDSNKPNKNAKLNKQKFNNQLNNNFDRFNNERFNQPIPSRMYIPKGYVRPMNPYGRPPFNPYFNPYFVPPYYYPPVHPGFVPPNANPYQQAPYLNQQQKELFPQQNSYTQQLIDFDPFASTTELVPANNYNQLSPNQNELVVVNKKQSELSHIISSFNKRMKEQLRIVSKQNEMIERLQTKVIELTEEKTTALIGEAKLSTEDFLPTTEHNFESVVTDSVEDDSKSDIEVVAELTPQKALTNTKEEVVVTNIFDIESDDPIVDISSLESDDLINTESLDKELAAFEEFDANNIDDELDLSLLDDDITSTIQPQIKYELPVVSNDLKSQSSSADKDSQFDLDMDVDLASSEDTEEIYTPNQLLDLGKERSEGMKNSIVPTKVIDEMFGNQQKSDPARRFWEAYVGNPEYGFYNNKTWNWKGKFSKLQKWIPFTSDEEVPFYGTKHVILSSIKASERKKLWKELIDDPVYGHIEGSSKVWIWHGVFDQELNWIPDPTHDFKTEEEVLAEKQKQSFPKKKDVSKKTNAPKVLKTNEITPDSDLHKMLLDDPRYKKHIGNVEYGYYDNDGVWIWTGTFDNNGEFKPDKVDLEILSENVHSESNFSTLFDSWKKNNQNNLEYEIESKRFKTAKPKVVYVNEQEQPDDDQVEQLVEKQEEPARNQLINKSRYQKPTDEDLGILTYDKSKIHNDEIIDGSVLGVSSSQQAPFWLEFIGNEEYGHYNSKGDWIFDGYFDDQYEFVSNRVEEDSSQPTGDVTKTSILDDQTNLDEYFKPANKEEILQYTPKAKKVEVVNQKADKKEKEEEFFTKFIGDSEYGYYNDKNVWIWSGYFNEYNQFVPDQAPKNNKLLDEIVSLATQQQKEQDLLKEKVERELAARQQAVEAQIQKELELREQALREQKAKEEALKLKEQSLNEKALRLKEEILKLKQQSLRNQEEAKKQALKEQEIAEQLKQIKSTKFIKPNKDNYKSIHQFVSGVSEISELPTQPVEFAPQPAPVVEQSLKAAEFSFEPTAVEQKVEFVVNDKIADDLDRIVVDTKQVELPSEKFSANSFVEQTRTEPVKTEVVKPQFEFKEELALTEISPSIVSDQASKPVVEISKPDVFAKKELDLSNVEVKLADETTPSEVVSVDLSAVELADSKFELAKPKSPEQEEVSVEPVVGEQAIEQVEEELQVEPELVEEEVQVEPELSQEEVQIEQPTAEFEEVEQPQEQADLVEQEDHQEVVQQTQQEVDEEVVEQPSVDESTAQFEEVVEQPQEQSDLVEQEDHQEVVQQTQQEVDEEVVQEPSADESTAQFEEVQTQDEIVDELAEEHASEDQPETQEALADQQANEERLQESATQDSLEQEQHEEVAQEEAEFWEKYVGDEHYGHYDENEEWIWDGYFDEDKNFFRNDEGFDQPEEVEVETHDDSEYMTSSADSLDDTKQPTQEEKEDAQLEEISEDEQPEPEIIDFSGNTKNLETAHEEVEVQQEVEEALQQQAQEQADEELLTQDEQEAEFWEKYVGDEHYGHYDENEEWIWDGYFDEDNNFFRNEEAQTAEQEEQTKPEELSEQPSEEESLSTQAVEGVELDDESEDDSELHEISEDDQHEPEIVDFSANTQGVEPAYEQPVEEQSVVQEDQPEEVEQEAADEELSQEKQSRAEPEEEAEFWEQYVGNEDYGHYDEDGEWIWAGYFDEDNNFIKNEEEVSWEEPEAQEVTEAEEQPEDQQTEEESENAEADSEDVEEVEVEGEHYIYADENGEINFDDYIGNENFGYYLEDGEWEWYEGDFDEKGNWFVYVQGEPEEVNVEEDIPALKGVDTDSVDADDWLSQFDEGAASEIFDDEDEVDDDDMDDDFGLLSSKKKKKKAKKAKK